MKINRRREEDVTILDLDGKLTIGEGDVVLRDKIREVLDSGARKLIMNMGNVRTMDSAGLGELVRAKATVSSHDAVVKLIGVHSKVNEVLEMTRLIGVFDIYDDEIDAVASMRG